MTPAIPQHAITALDKTHWKDFTEDQLEQVGLRAKPLHAMWLDGETLKGLRKTKKLIFPTGPTANMAETSTKVYTVEWPGGTTRALKEITFRNVAAGRFAASDPLVRLTTNRATMLIACAVSSCGS